VAFENVKDKQYNHQTHTSINKLRNFIQGARAMM
jgi:hypothetical protein